MLLVKLRTVLIFNFGECSFAITALRLNKVMKHVS